VSLTSGELPGLPSSQVDWNGGSAFLKRTGKSDGP
jgi:hypothetical protein